MKIYTKTGDEGTTSLFGGDRILKSHPRVDAYGTVDELNSHIGLIADAVDNDDLTDTLRNVQDKLFVIGSILATVDEKYLNKIPHLQEEDIIYLEQLIDQYTEKLPAMNHFILPGGHVYVSYCHIARCVCRRAERNIIELQDSQINNTLIIKYLNRLSDFLFTLARKLIYDLNVKEIYWIPKK